MPLGFNCQTEGAGRLRLAFLLEALDLLLDHVAAKGGVAMAQPMYLSVQSLLIL